MLHVHTANDMYKVITLYADASPFPYSITCNTNASQPLLWITANMNETNFNFLTPDTRISISNDTKVLTLLNVKAKDEKYYACGYVNNAKTFQVLSTFLLYVRSKRRSTLFILP